MSDTDTQPTDVNADVKARLLKGAALFGLILALCAVGCLCSLFGPAALRLLGVVAFLLIWSAGFYVITSRLHDRSKWQRSEGLVSFYPALESLRSLFYVALLTCAMTSVVTIIGFIAAAASGGVADGTIPVFAQQSEYLLCNHGVYTTVTRAHYIAVGAAFVVGWHAFTFSFGLVGLFFVVYGSWPFGPEIGTSSQPETGEKT